MVDTNQKHYPAVLVARSNRAVYQSDRVRAEILPVYSYSVVGWALSDGCRIEFTLEMARAQELFPLHFYSLLKAI